MANVTIELLFAGVRDNVPHQMLFPAERFVTAGLVAFERTQAQMQFQMLGQVFLALEHFMTLVACGHIWFWFSNDDATVGWYGSYGCNCAHVGRLIHFGRYYFRCCSSSCAGYHLCGLSTFLGYCVNWWNFEWKQYRIGKQFGSIRSNLVGASRTKNYVFCCCCKTANVQYYR